MLYLKSVFVLSIIIVLEIINGILRGKFLTPRFGDFRARQLSTLTGCISIFIVSLIFIGWIAPSSVDQALAIGAIWFVLMLVFEIGFGRLVFKFTWKFIFQDFNLFEGRLLALGMIFLAFAPLIAGRLMGIL